MYFPHTRTSWDKHMFNGMPNSNFKIGLSLFGCAENYLNKVHIVQCECVGGFSNDLLDQMTY